MNLSNYSCVLNLSTEIMPTFYETSCMRAGQRIVCELCDDSHAYICDGMDGGIY